jgi:microcystin-dependent protein
MSEPFIAEVRIFAGNFAPRGWAFCNGQLLPIAQNTALFSLIGTTYGGDGRTTTGLPNLKGRAPMHPGRGPGLSSRRLGERGGSETITLSGAQMPNHNHALRASGMAADEEGTGNPANATLGATDLADAVYGPAGGTLPSMAAGSLQNEGGSQAHNNMQPYLTLYFIIALVGTYPSRS